MATENEQPDPTIPKDADQITYRSGPPAAQRTGAPVGRRPGVPYELSYGSPFGKLIAETRKKKKKRKYSSGLKGVQGLERGLTKSLGMLSEGLAKVYDVYNDRRDDSAAKKKDGALRDALENWAKAVSKGMRIASKGPYEFVKAVNKGGGSKQMRKTVRILTPPPLR